MKFRAKKANFYKDITWPQGAVAEFTKQDVHEAIGMGFHTTTDKKDKTTKKPVSQLLNHWLPMDREAKAAVSRFIRRQGR